MGLWNFFNRQISVFLLDKSVSGISNFHKCGWIGPKLDRHSWYIHPDMRIKFQPDWCTTHGWAASHQDVGDGAKLLTSHFLFIKANFLLNHINIMWKFDLLKIQIQIFRHFLVHYNFRLTISQKKTIVQFCWLNLPKITWELDLSETRNFRIKLFS